MYNINNDITNQRWQPRQHTPNKQQQQQQLQQLQQLQHQKSNGAQATMQKRNHADELATAKQIN